MKKAHLFFLAALCLLFPLAGQGEEKSTFVKKWSPDQKMTYEDGRHLLSRTSFGGTPQEIRALTKLTYEEAVDHLLSQIRSKPHTSPPTWVDAPYPDYAKAKKKGKKFYRKFRQKQNKRRQKMRRELKAWWFKEMCHTPSPLTEKLVLFWHNHFTSSLRETNWPTFMYDQNELFRQEAAGNFRRLLHAICKDKAMVLYLDNHTNRKGRPNENFARELMELFTLGEGYYTEKDIKESARAFTGYMVHFRKDKFYFHPRRHDWGEKEFMGRKGHFTGEDIVEILLKKKRTAIYIVENLWREFISPRPQAREVRRLARIFRRHNYEIKPLLRALFTSPHFWHPENRGKLIKSPAELLVGTARLFQVPVRNGSLVYRYSIQLGQNLFDPPNVKGWEGGERWITSHTLLRRRAILRHTMYNLGYYSVKVGYCNQGCKSCKKKRKDQLARRKKMRQDQKKRILKQMELKDKLDNKERKQLVKTLLPIPPRRRLPKKVSPLNAVRHLVLDPGYQLK